MSRAPAATALPLAPAARCTRCGAALDPLRPTPWPGVCGRFDCQAAHASEMRRETRERRRAEARNALVAAGLDPDAVSWSTTPHHPHRIAPLEAESREAFLAHLAEVVAEAEAASGTPSGAATEASPVAADAPEPFGPPDSAPDPPELGLACAGCRGWCCARGGTHAYVEPSTLRRVWGEALLDPAGTVAAYAAHLPDRHALHGCVFHGEAGCTLPRHLRSDTCNGWFCDELDAVRRSWAAGGGPRERHVFVAVDRATARVDGLRVVEPRPDPEPAAEPGP